MIVLNGTTETTNLLISEEEIRNRIFELAVDIARYYKDEEFTILCVLKGGFIFGADLYRDIYRMNQNVELEFIKASSYGNGLDSSGEVDIEASSLDIIKNKNILIVEDIIDRGYTLKNLKNLLIAAEAKSVRICALLDKHERRIVDIEADYVGFKIPNEFVIGYGIDYAEKYRGLSEIHTLKLFNK